MAKRKSWPMVVDARVYCPACEQWYQTLVPRAYFVQHFVKRPDIPVIECALCQKAKWLAQVSGGRWQQWRNWERGASSVAEETKPSEPGQAVGA